MRNIKIVPDLTRPEMTVGVTRGVTRVFKDMGLVCLTEFRLPNGRRVDVAGLCRKGRLIFAEVKSCEADFAVDEKWDEYLGYCDGFYFAVAENFPREILPPTEGVIIADGFGGSVLQEADERPLNSARRKALTLRFARQAARRISSAP